MINGMTRSARFSRCGNYRWTLTRAWDGRPMLLVVMFNPSKANDEIDDNTVSLVCQIAAHNGYGGIVVVNGIPICSSKPAPAYEMLDWEARREWSDRDLLGHNVSVIQQEAARAGAVLLAWGALADRCDYWFDHVLEQIGEALPEGVPIYCLGKTAAGHPKHPLARGKHKVRKDAPLLPWKT